MPALPQLADELAISASQAQLTLTVCMVGLALGQVVAGPLSDRFGRRPPMLVGVAGFVVISLLCAIAPNLAVLLVLRFAQGLGGACGVVVAQAIVRDLYEGPKLVSFYGRLAVLGGLSAVLGPTLGGQLSAVTDWRGIFVVLGGIGAVIFMVSLLLLPETLASEHRHQGGIAARVVLSVKTGVVLDGNPHHGGGSRRWFTRAVEGSLRRLRTDYIDVYEYGAPDPHTDVDETLGALTDLVAAGKIRTFGTSKMPPSQIAEDRALAERRGHGVFRTEEAPYSILNRVVEYDLLPVCQRLGVGVLAFSAVAGGWLSGRYRIGRPVVPSGPRSHRPQMDAAAPANAAKLAAADALGLLADESGLTLVQLATAWAARHPAVSSVIIGPRTLSQLEGFLAAGDVVLSDDVLDRIDAIVAPGVTLDVADAMWVHGTRSLDADQRRR